MLARARPVLVACSVFLGAAGCCSYQVTVAGSSRSCVPLPWRKAGPKPPPAARTERLPTQWDERLGIYRVVGEPCLFVRAGTLFRRRDARWETAPSLAGPWSRIPVTGLPAGFHAELARAECDAPNAPATDD